MVALGLGLTVVACDPGVQLEDYKRSCFQDADCMVIFVGHVCECECHLGAIHVSEGQKYLDDRGDPSCTVDCTPCPEGEAICRDSACIARWKEL